MIFFNHMGFRKFASLDHLSSNKSKVISGFCVIIAVSLLVLSFLFMSNSSQISFLRSTSQGLNLNRSSTTATTLFSSWFFQFSGKGSSTSFSSGSVDSELRIEEESKKTHESNFSENAKGGTFVTFAGEVVEKSHGRNSPVGSEKESSENAKGASFMAFDGDVVGKSHGGNSSVGAEKRSSENFKDASFTAFDGEVVEKSHKENSSVGVERGSSVNAKSARFMAFDGEVVENSPESSFSAGAKNASSENAKSASFMAFGGEVVEKSNEGNSSVGAEKGSSFSGEQRDIMMFHEGNFSEVAKNASFLSVGGENLKKTHHRNGSKEADVSSCSASDKMIKRGTQEGNSCAFDGRRTTGKGHVGKTYEIVRDGSSNLQSSSQVKRSSGASGKCDIFHGKWVRDEGRPYYLGGSCPYIDKDFNCFENGRPDDSFLRWRWQPYDCDIPCLNATDFLQRLGGKRIVFVGDSLNRNMWQSLVCILYHGVSNKDQVIEVSGKREFKVKGYYSFRYVDYNCSVDYVRSPFLVKQSSVKGSDGPQKTLILDVMDEKSIAYQEADVLVFNTAHWWTHDKSSKGKNYYQEGQYVYPMLNVMEAYKKALTTWARWIDKNISAKRTRVFFRGYSPKHYSARKWHSSGKCHETEPLFNETYLGKYPSNMKALEQVVLKMKTPMVYLNVTKLSDYRKDGHPSIYTEFYHAGSLYQDCSHWCLPGVPDTWNELLYASLVMDGWSSRKF